MSDPFFGKPVLASEEWCDFCGRHIATACVCWTMRSPWRPAPAERVPVLDPAKCVGTSTHDDRDPGDEDRRDVSEADAAHMRSRAFVRWGSVATMSARHGALARLWAKCKDER